MDYRQTLDYLYGSLPDFQQDGAAAYKPGLDRVREFAAVLGNPERAMRSIHVAGTNGKGSVSHILASVLISAGYRTGLYTSPHISDFRERIRVDGRMINREEVVDFVSRHRAPMDSLRLSFFEMTVGMAFDHFAREGVDIAVVETGLGGRLDATNIITPVLSVITNIGLDHQSLLGGTTARIAAEKAGIIKPGVPVVIGERDGESEPVFAAKAAREGAPLFFAQTMYGVAHDFPATAGRRFTLHNLACGALTELELDLGGDCQRRNIVTVAAAADVLDSLTSVSIRPGALAAGAARAAATTGLRGRWEVLGHAPLVVCDTGHNEHGFDTILGQLDRFDSGRLFMVLGFAADKDITGVLRKLPRRAHYIFTSASSARSLPAADLARMAAEAGLSGEVADAVPQAVARARSMAAPEDMIFIGGSTFVVADAVAAEGGR